MNRSDDQMKSIGAEMMNALANFVGCDAPKEQPDDYIGDDGLLYCHNCHTKKQTRLKFPKEFGGGERIVPCCCKCESDRIDEEARRRKEAERRNYIAQLKSASLMDSMFKESTFNNARIDQYNNKAMTWARNYATRFDEMLARNRGAVFYGDPGTGKTYTAACIANHVLDRGISVMMTSFVKLNMMCGLNRTERDQKILDAMSEVKLLIIDDLGAERGSDFSLERVYSFIDTRVRAKLPLILTTNFNLQEMQSTADMRYWRIFDRVFQVCFPVEVAGPSRRLREAAKVYQEMESLFNE